MEVITKIMKEAKKNDLLIFDGENWQPTSIDFLLKPYIKRLENIEDDRISNDKKIDAYDVKITELKNYLIKFLKTEVKNNE